MTDLIVRDEAKVSQFKKLTDGSNLNLEKELVHVGFLCEQNNYLQNAIKKNPNKLWDCLFQLATTGLSLCPSKKQTYLIPRGSGVQLSIGYIGLVDLAVMEGSVIWVKSELVFKNEEFIIKGPGLRPVHNFDPFSQERADIKNVVGCYCLTKTCDGEYLTETMSLAEILSIKKRSPAAQKGSSPWQTDFSEMAKKTVIRRASKLWPKKKKLTSALEIVNRNEPIIHYYEEGDIKPGTPQQIKHLYGLLGLLGGDSIIKMIKHVNDKFKQDRKTVNDFSENEISYSIQFLMSNFNPENRKKAKEILKPTFEIEDINAKEVPPSPEEPSPQAELPMGEWPSVDQTVENLK